MKKQNYSLLTKFEREEKEKQDFQDNCSHTFWSTRCGVCTRILASDHHINFHTPRSFKKDNRVALYMIDSGKTGDLDLYRIQELKRFAHEYDEVTVIVTSLKHLEEYESLRYPTRVVFSTIDEEVRHMRKYRREDVKEINLLLYPDTSQHDELERKAKRLKIISKVI